MERQFLQKWQNGTAQMRKTLNEEISLCDVREQELKGNSFRGTAENLGSRET